MGLCERGGKNYSNSLIEIKGFQTRAWLNAVDRNLTWLSVSFQECELNLANLYKSEVEFDEDYTIPPENFGKLFGFFPARVLPTSAVAQSEYLQMA